MSRLILASSSQPRARLLERLGIPFETISPEIDESPRPGEAPHRLALRLAVEKARRVAQDQPQAVVIGSDQVVHLEGTLKGKPGNSESAIADLAEYSGQVVQFLTSVALVAEGERVLGESVVETRVQFRALGADEIRRYVEADQPYQCAGGFKAESLGPSLFESAFSQDPTAIVGLPLIETARLLRLAGFQVP
ncbi:MAG: nucleoside triphosphate pyrophosphatase [Xanthomonadales bacterium]|nr:nucleoside triphosphate pyrophosphatase [Xanthomonadales bacterium]